jgi:FlaA1/EpsC-like NDP-sugar epimerase
MKFLKPHIKRSISVRHLLNLSILAIDVFISLVSFTFALLLVKNFTFSVDNSIGKTLILVLVFRALCCILFRTYAFIVRYFGLRDLAKLFIACAIGSSALIVFHSISKFGANLPIAVWIIDFIILLFFLTAVRYVMRLFSHYRIATRNKIDKHNTIMFGAGESGSMTLQMMRNNDSQPYNLRAIFDDNPHVHRKELDGVPIYNPSVFEGFVKKKQITHAILSIQNIQPERKKELVELCLKNDIIVQQIPASDKWLKGILDVKSIQNINVEELLSRLPIKLNCRNIEFEIKDKVVVITGGAGSIGSEIVRQCVRFKPKKLIIIDQAESPIVDIGLEIKELFDFHDIETIVGDVMDKALIDRVFSRTKPHIVFHAAAYKHVPIMEDYPAEAVKVNIFGTKNVADACVRFGVKKFVMVSTDKAVNPTNVMGASKRIAEIYIQSLNNADNTGTSFITTRFGNVLGSNGSVILRFKKQLEARLPITVTHPDIIRYFMTIPEACQLVLEAGSMGKGGEIFIFDMGKPVKILDLAINTIKLAGLRPYKDVDIVFTGLRSGEKLYEELLNNAELTIPTHHEKIMKAKVREYEFNMINDQIQKLIKLAINNNHIAVVRQMKSIVPEFISKNSKFSNLDETLYFSPIS